MVLTDSAIHFFLKNNYYFERKLLKNLVDWIFCCIFVVKIRNETFNLFIL
jgi:hypothetical protein